MPKKKKTSLSFGGAVRGFANYTDAQLDRMAEDLGLSQNPVLYHFCQNYYRKTERRDPSIPEIRMVDRLARKGSDPAVSFGVREFLTNDPETARTYADLMNKRRELFGDNSRPLTLGEAMRIPTLYLQKIGKSAVLPGAEIRLKDAEKSRGIVSPDAIGVANSRFFLEILPERTKPAESASPLCFCLLPANAGEFPWVYRRRADEALADWKIASLAENLLPISERGILATLLPVADSVWFDLKMLNQDDNGAPLTVLTEKHIGEYLVTVRENQLPALSETCREKKLTLIPFAISKKDAKYRFASNGVEAFSLSHSFLTSLTPLRALSLKTADEKPNDAVEIKLHTAPETLSRCRYFAKAGAAKTVRVRDFTVSVASAALSANAFRNAVEVSLASILNTALQSRDTAEIKTAIGLNIPAPITSENAGASLSAVLGVYRTLCELGLPATSLALRSDTAIQAPELTVFSVTRGDPLPETAQSAGSPLYLFKPKSDKGIPDFESVRNLLSRVSVLRESRKIKAGMLLTGESLTEALSAFLPETLTAGIDIPTAVSTGCLQNVLMLETENEIGGQRFAHTAPATSVYGENEPSGKPETLCLSSYLRTRKPATVLFAAPADYAAPLFASALEAKGLQTTLFQAEKTSAQFDGDPAEAIRNAQSILLLGNAEMPEDDQVFAFSHKLFKSSGGAVLRLGEAAHSPEETGYPDGLTEQALQALLHPFKTE